MICTKHTGSCTRSRVQVSPCTKEPAGTSGSKRSRQNHPDRCIAGRAKPDRGTISLRDEILAPNTPRHNLGIVPQEIAVYDKLSIRENLATFARLHGVSAEELPARITWALDWIGLTDRQASLVGTLSGGMKRRVNIACGVMHQPKIIILDEPTVGVDPQSRERIYDMLATLRNDGVSIVLTTHQWKKRKLAAIR